MLSSTTPTAAEIVPFQFRKLRELVFPEHLTLISFPSFLPPLQSTGQIVLPGHVWRPGHGLDAEQSGEAIPAADRSIRSAGSSGRR